MFNDNSIAKDIEKLDACRMNTMLIATMKDLQTHLEQMPNSSTTKSETQEETDFVN